MNRFCIFIWAVFINLFQLYGQDYQNDFYKGLVHYNQENYSRTINVLKKALISLREGSNYYKDSSYSQILWMLGNSHHSLQEYDNAIPYYLELMEHYELKEGKNSTSFNEAIYAIALSHLLNGNYAKAESLLEPVVQFYTDSEDREHINYARASKALGDSYVSLRKFEEAQLLYEQSLEVYKQEKEGDYHQEHVGVLHGLGKALRAQGKHDQARSIYLEALELTDKYDGKTSKSFGLALEELADLYIELRQLDKAEKLLSQAGYLYRNDLELKPKDYTSVLLARGYIYRLRGKYNSSLIYFDSAFSHFKKKKMANHPYYAPWLSRYLGVKMALKQYEDVEKLVKIIKANYAKQITEFFPYLTQKEKEQFFYDIQWRFEIFNSIVLERFSENPEFLQMMYDNQLANKGLLLNETNKWKKRILNSGDLKLIKDFLYWQGQKEILGQYYQKSEVQLMGEGIKLKNMEKEVNKLEKRLAKNSERFRDHSDVNKFSWKDVRKTLGPGEAAIEIIRFRKFDFLLGNKFTDTINYVALIQTSAGSHPQMVLIENGKELEKKYLSHYRNSILFKKKDTLSYAQFWKPFQTELLGIKKIYLSPDGVYNLINVNTLYDPKDKKYLLDKFDIQPVTNTKDLITPPEQESLNNLVILLGDPDFSKDRLLDQSSGYAGLKIDRFQELPGTRKEVETLSRLFKEKGWDQELWMGKEASEQNLKNSFKPRVLHIATHGYFEGGEGNLSLMDLHPLLRSGLVLSTVLGSGYHLAEDSNDGLLTSYEVTNLNLDNTELVVLSACETGLGEFKNGEGVYGLQRAFKVAGANAIIMSLWKVNDQTTQELMELFYKNWLESGDKRAALHKAQSHLKEKYSYPYYWGAFVMLGE